MDLSLTFSFPKVAETELYCLLFLFCKKKFVRHHTSERKFKVMAAVVATDFITTRLVHPSVDFDRPSDHEEAFAKDLAEFPSVENGAGTNDDDDSSIGLPVQRKRKKAHPPTPLDQCYRQDKEGHSAAGLSLSLINDQAFSLVTAIAGDVVTSVVSAAVREQLQSVQEVPSISEEADAEEGDDFELLDQSELEHMESELVPTKSPKAEPQEKKSSGFLSNLLGGH